MCPKGKTLRFTVIGFKSGGTKLVLHLQVPVQNEPVCRLLVGVGMGVCSPYSRDTCMNTTFGQCAGKEGLILTRDVFFEGNFLPVPTVHMVREMRC